MAPVVNASKHRVRRADGVAGIGERSIRKCARRGGVKRIETSIYQTTREVIECKLRQIIPRAMRYAKLHNRNTINTFDIVYAIKDTPGMCSGIVSPMLCPPHYSNNNTTITSPVIANSVAEPVAEQPLIQVPEVSQKTQAILSIPAVLEFSQASAAALQMADYHTRLRNWKAIPNDVKRAMRRGARAADFDVSDTTDEYADADALERKLTIGPIWADDAEMPAFKYPDDEDTFNQINHWRHVVADKAQAALNFRIGKTPSASSMGKN